MKKFLSLFPIVALAIACGQKAASPAPVPPPSASPAPPSVPALPTGEDGCQIGRTVGYSGEVENLINTKCVSCHPGYDSYAVAGNPGLANQIVDRVNLASGDVRRMPKFPGPELSVQEKTLLADWKAGGFAENSACKTVDQEAFLDFDAIESFILADLNRTGSRQTRENSRYLIMTHRKNQGKQLEDFRTYIQGMNKAMNSLSSTDEIVLASPIDPGESIYRIDLRQYGLTTQDWNAVLTKEPFNFISQTSTGLQIAQLTGTPQPWLHGENWTFTSMGDPVLYNQLNRVQATLAEHQAKFGVNEREAVDNFEARMMCFNGSPISENKNRGLMRLPADGNTKGFWQTYDPNSQFTAEKNCFEFPLVGDVGEKRFVFDASETIGFKDNGLMDFGLWAAADDSRQTEAPVDVVVNNQSPFNSIIKNGLDCLRCHSNGLLPFQDQILPHALANASEFSRDDFELIKTYFRSATTNNALVIADNRPYEEALRKMGIDPGGLDPTNFWLDGYRADWTREDAAAFVFMTPDEFCINLNSSAQGKAQLGTLCSNPPGTVTFQQFQASFPTILRDFRLGQDALDE